MPKIKSRRTRMQEYEEAFPIRNPDALSRLESYLSKQKNPDKILQKAADKAVQILEDREYESIHITLYEYPFQTARPRTFKGHTFSPNAAENKAYFDTALHKVIETIKLINTPGEIEVEAYLEMPKAVPPEEVILFEARLLTPVEKPDYDNVGKCYTDMLTDVLIIDDDIFWRGEIKKFYSLLPRVEITIRYITKHESKYIYKKLKSRKTIKHGLETGQVVLRYIGEE